jgi:hypothetical protein
MASTFLIKNVIDKPTLSEPKVINFEEMKPEDFEKSKLT